MSATLNKNETTTALDLSFEFFNAISEFKY